jgi:hypothetical protein
VRVPSDTGLRKRKGFAVGLGTVAMLSSRFSCDLGEPNVLCVIEACLHGDEYISVRIIEHERSIHVDGLPI